MIVGSQVEPTDVEEMLRFYKQTFAVVDVVSCGKCKSFLAFECAGGDAMGMQPNELGKFVIPIGDKLMAHRVRLDENAEGERMVGYQCACGNNTKLCEAEKGLVPVGQTLVQLSPFEKFKIAEHIRADRKYKPNWKRQGNKVLMDGFTVERA